MAAFLITKASVSISASTLQNCLRRGPVLTHHSCHSLGFLDTELTWSASFFYFSTLSMLTASKAAMFPKTDIHQALHRVLFRHPSSFFPGEGSALCPHRLEPASATPRLQRAQPGPPFTPAAVTYRGQWAPSSIRGASEMGTVSQRL